MFPTYYFLFSISKYIVILSYYLNRSITLKKNLEEKNFYFSVHREKKQYSNMLHYFQVLSTLSPWNIIKCLTEDYYLRSDYFYPLVSRTHLVGNKDLFYISFCLSSIESSQKWYKKLLGGHLNGFHSELHIIV